MAPAVTETVAPPQPEDAHTETLDPRALNAIRGLQRPGGPDLLARVVRLYLEEAPRLFGRLSEALAAGDVEAFTRSAHTLKSSSANLGAHALAERCRELEMRGRAGQLDGTAALVAEVESSLDRVTVALEPLLGGVAAAEES